MAIGHGSAAALLLDGYALTGFGKSAQIVPSIDMHDNTVFGATAHSRVPGLKHGTLSAELFYDDTATVGSYDVLKTKYAAQSPGTNAPALLSLAPQGFTLGNRVSMMYGSVRTFDTKLNVADLSMLTLNAEASEDGVDFGVSLHALTAETGTATGTAVDNAASSANGGVGTLHVTAIAGAAPSVVVTIEHSTDNSTYVTLVTFVASTAANIPQRIEVVAGTTVRRYLRVVTTFGGTTTSITHQASFARR